MAFPVGSSRAWPKGTYISLARGYCGTSVSEPGSGTIGGCRQGWVCCGQATGDHRDLRMPMNGRLVQSVGLLGVSLVCLSQVWFVCLVWPQNLCAWTCAKTFYKTDTDQDANFTQNDQPKLLAQTCTSWCTLNTPDNDHSYGWPMWK